MARSFRRLAWMSQCGIVLACFCSAGFARTWSDASGKFKIDADLVSIDGDQVTLKRSDGKLIHLPVDKLSQADQDFLTKKPAHSPAGEPGESANPAAKRTTTPRPQPKTDDVTPTKHVNGKQDAKQIAAAEQQVDELYKNDLLAAKARQQRIDVAQKMVQISSSEADINARYALAHRGALLAASVGDARTAFAGMRVVESVYDEPLSIWVDCLEILLAHNPDDPVLPSEKIDALIFDALAKGEFVAAAKLAAMSSAAARLTRDPSQIALAKQKAAEVAAAKDEAKKFAAAQEQLKQNPADPSAKAEVGRFLCLVRRDWEAGLPLLKESNDKLLQPIAVAELKANKTPAELAALGDSWFVAAKKVPLHMAAQARGFYWYQQALPFSKGLARIKIEKELAAHQARIGVDLLSRVDIPRDGSPSGAWSMQGHALVSTTGGEFAMISFPTPKNMARYELSVELTSKVDANGVMIFFPVGARSVGLRLGDRRNADGLSLINGLLASEPQNPTSSRPGSLVAEARCLVVIDVQVKETDAEILVETNKRRIISWKGPISQLSVSGGFAPAHREWIGITSMQDQMLFYSVGLVYSKAAASKDAEDN